MITPPRDALCYLGTPYSRFKGGVYKAFEEASRLAARLLRAGVKVYSPIAHTHSIATYGDIDPLDHHIWLPFDEVMMARCDVLIVAEMSGWQESKGVTHEISFFRQRNRPIYHLDPESLTMRRVREESAVSAGVV